MTDVAATREAAGSTTLPVEDEPVAPQQSEGDSDSLMLWVRRRARLAIMDIGRRRSPFGDWTDVLLSGNG